MGSETRVPQRRHAGESRHSPGLAFLTVAATTLALALVGILTRQVGFLAAFWPANAVLVGLFVRVPSLATPLGWLAAFVGFACADLATGSSVTKMLLLTFGNLVEITAAYLALKALAPEHQRLRQPFSILYVFGACVVGAVAAGVSGIWPGVALYDLPPLDSALTWFASALAGSMAILPLVLATPSMRGRSDILQVLVGEARRAAAPFALLVVSLAAGLAVGGPAAVMAAVPALLFCALVAGLFPTTVLNVIATAWTMIAITSTDILLLGELPSKRTILSIQVGLSFLVMGPIAVAANVASRDEALRRLRQTAARDALTGALTRGAFEREAAETMSRLAAEGRPVSVLMFDLDRFKEINDTHGHLAGDRVLVEFAELTENSLRDSDVFGRIGGEEFAVVLPGVRRDMAALVAERIRDVFDGRAIEHDSQLIEATVSVGNAYFEHAPVELATALAAADRALYRAKQTGRNRVVTESAVADQPAAAGVDVKMPSA